jgi:hypothetical protein
MPDNRCPNPADLSKVGKTVGLDDFLAKRGGFLVNVNRTNKKPADPNPFGYFHATSSQWSTVYGSTQDQMGSGREAADGWAHAAYQRILRNQSNASAAMVNFDGVPEVDAAASNCPANDYTIQCFMDSGSSWGSYQFYGGPSS